MPNSNIANPCNNPDRLETNAHAAAANAAHITMFSNLPVPANHLEPIGESGGEEKIAALQSARSHHFEMEEPTGKSKAECGLYT
jgi:hypothetical protein